jgi:hypothetical protein
VERETERVEADESIDVVVSGHALARWKERFDGDIEIPTTKIKRISKLVKEDHEDFFVRTVLAVYCCIRQHSGRVYIKTIMWNLN